MESLGDILKKKKIPTATSRENTDTLSSADSSEEAPSCPVCKGAGFIHPRLASGDVDYSHVVPCRCTQKELKKNNLARLQHYSNLGSLMRLTFKELITQGQSGDPQNQAIFLRAHQAATSFAENPQGWLVFTGPSGCGKTHLAAAIANYCIHNAHPAFFISVFELMDHLRSAFSPSSDISYDELFERVREAPLLVLDDMGARSTTPWAQEKLFQIINHRFNNQLPTVITIVAGMNLEELDERWCTRLTDPAFSQIYLLEEKKPPILDYSSSLGLELLASMTFESFDSKRVNLPPEQRQNLEEAFRLAQNFAQAPDGWLVFQGTNGCGKTHLAAAIANYNLRAGRPVSVIIVPDFLDHLRSTYSPDSKITYDDFFERVKRAPFLILDDFGEHSSTPWAQEKLYQLINYRYNTRLPTVITTCCTLDDIETRISSRMADHKLSTAFNIMAPDYRSDRSPARKAKPRRSQRG
ncbi:ATP-binding protein [Chloroflexota bacterium]